MKLWFQALALFTVCSDEGIRLELPLKQGYKIGLAVFQRIMKVHHLKWSWEQIPYLWSFSLLIHRRTDEWRNRWTNKLTDQRMVRHTCKDRLTDWVINCLIDWLIKCLMVSLLVWFIFNLYVLFFLRVKWSLKKLITCGSSQHMSCDTLRKLKNPGKQSFWRNSMMDMTNIDFWVWCL